MTLFGKIHWQKAQSVWNMVVDVILATLCDASSTLWECGCRCRSLSRPQSRCSMLPSSMFVFQFTGKCAVIAVRERTRIKQLSPRPRINRRSQHSRRKSTAIWSLRTSMVCLICAFFGLMMPSRLAFLFTKSFLLLSILRFTMRPLLNQRSVVHLVNLANFASA